MNKLDTERIDEYAPYKVEMEDGQYIFETDHDILYGVSFDEETMPGSLKAYWFNLTNHSQKASPRDSKIRATVILIIEEFFRSNPDILLYMCDSANNQQAQRARLFLRWFNGYEQRQHYYIKAVEVKGEDNTNDYVALIVQRTHPQFDEIVARFDSEVAMFNEFKP